MTRRKNMKSFTDAELLDAYKRLNSTYKVAKKFGVTRHSVKKRLKELGALNSQSQAAKNRGTEHLKYERTAKHKKRLSEISKKRTGSKNPFYGKKHTPEVRKKLSDLAQQRTKERNPNYKTGKYQRRPRDFKIHQFRPLRNYVFNRDKHTCHYCKTKGGHLHAHHILPYWLCEEAFLDANNLITVCSKCHFDKAHIGDWAKFDLDLITEILITTYHIHRERLSELASKWKKR